MSGFARQGWAAVLTAIGTILPGPGWSFDEDGYSSGMNVDAVARSLVKRGTILRALGQADAKGNQTFVEMPGQPGVYGVASSFSFCHDRLVFYAANLAGDFNTFIRTAERRTADLGPARYTAQTAGTPASPYAQFRLVWSGPGWSEWLDLRQIGSQTLEVSRAFKDDQTECD